jgi:hypothetical protein
MYLYRVLATNLVGDPRTYGFMPAPNDTIAIGFPTVTKNSLPSNIDANKVGVTSIVRASADPTNAADVNFTVTFSEPVSGVVTGDFSLANSTVGGSPAVNSVSPDTGTSATFTVNVSTGTTNGTLQLDMINGTLGGPFTSGETYTVVKDPPTVTSIVSATTSPTNLTGMVYTVTFNRPVVGVDTTDFFLTTTGLTGSSVKTVAAVSGTTYTVTIATGTGNPGTLRLDLHDNNTITDMAGLQLGGAVLNDGDYALGTTYTVDNVVPTVLSSVRVAGATNPTNDTSVSFTVTFSETVTGVDLTDFSLTPKVTGASVTSVSGTGPYTVVVNTGTGVGSLRLNVNDNHSIKDTLGNALGGTGVQPYTSGESYTIGIPVGPGKYDDVSGLARWSYTGTWTAWAGSGPYLGTNHYSTTIGDAAQVNITGGQQIKLTYARGTNRGVTDVYIDGVKVASIHITTEHLAGKGRGAAKYLQLAITQFALFM